VGRALGWPVSVPWLLDRTLPRAHARKDPPRRGVLVMACRPAVLILMVAGVLAGCSGGPGTGGAETPAASAAAPNAGGPTGTSVPAGGDLCGLLGQGDWAGVGVTDASTPTENNSPPDSYFCVYRGKSSATGGLELDVFLSPTPGDAHDSLADAFSEFVTSTHGPVTIDGADEALLSLPSSDGSTDPAIIAARHGTLSFLLGMGSSYASAQRDADRLKQLAALILARSGNLGS